MLAVRSVSWRQYYGWRGLALSSPVATPLSPALSLYYIITSLVAYRLGVGWCLGGNRLLTGPERVLLHMSLYMTTDQIS